MSDASDLLDDLRLRANVLGMQALGVADTGPLLQQVPGLFERLPRPFPRAVVMGVRLHDAAVQDVDDQPTLLYFHNYRQANYALDRAAFAVAGSLQNAGFESLAVPASQLLDRHDLIGHISHKLLGWAAGLGWIGRSTLLVNPRHGARMRYVSVLTDAPLPANAPMDGNCRSCRRCAGACPAGAIHDSRGDFDLEACAAKLREFTRIQGIGQMICGVCVKACGGAQWRGQFEEASE